MHEQDWHGRALRLRAQGHTMKFIARQIGQPEGEVIAYLSRIEREREMKRCADLKR